MRSILVFSFLFLISLGSIAQSKSGYQLDQPKKRVKKSSGSNWMEKIYVQPTLGLAFGSNSAFVNVGGTVGYKITDNFSVGTGLTYTYSKFELVDVSTGRTLDVKSNTFGGNVFARYLIYDPIFVTIQYEALTTKFDFENVNERLNYGAFLAGAGFLQRLSRNGAVFLQVLYNFSYDDEGDFRDNGPYTSPYVVSAGFLIGF